MEKSEAKEGPDDYHHRMKMNVLGFAVTVVLMGAAIWLVLAIADLRRGQDCFLSGNRNCAPIGAATR